MNLASIVDGHPDSAVALIGRGRQTTYGELRQQVAEMRGGLARAGVEPGDRVGIVAANNAVFVVTYLAVLGVGAVAVPLNPTSPARELRAELEAVGAELVVVAQTEGSALDLPGAKAFGELQGAPAAPVVDRADSDLAVLIFTAGTSGSPKAAMLTHGNLRTNIEQMQRHPGRALNELDVAFGVLPLFHIFGLNVMLGLTLHAGGTILLVERFDPGSALDSIRDHGITIVAGAPPMFAAWATIDAPQATPEAVASVRLFVSGAAPLSPEVAEAFEARYGKPIFQGYGLTEAGPTVTSSVVGGEAKPGSIGLPLPGVEVRLVDAEGHDVFEGDEGEIWVRGPNVFTGYWHDDAATSAAIAPGGWLRTGDVAVTDDDGFLYIVDRVKDLVIVSGFNVYPAEVEAVLASHPGVLDVGVVGVPHPYTGETVKAFVVPEPGHLVEEDQLIEYCAGRLARYKCPTKITFVDEVPKATGGKLLRRDLRLN